MRGQFQDWRYDLELETGQQATPSFGPPTYLLMRRHPLLTPITLSILALLTYSGSASAQCLSSRNSSLNGTGGDRFGRDVASSGNDLLIGAPQTDRNAQFNSGSVYRFLRTPTGFEQQEEWVPADSGSNDSFGEALDFDGEWAAIAAFSDDDNGTDSGSVYLWKQDRQHLDRWPKAAGQPNEHGRQVRHVHSA